MPKFLAITFVFLGLSICLLTVIPNFSFAQTGCTISPPQITILTQMQTVKTGQTVTYQFKVTNFDTANCPQTTFRAEIPYFNEWNPYIDPALFTLAPGQSTNGLVSFTPPLNKQTGLYTVPLTVTDTSLATHSKSEYLWVYVTSDFSVRIQPGYIDTAVGSTTQLSALALDSKNQGISTGVTYEWGISSTNSIGTLKTAGDLATFTALHGGHGDLYVIARKDAYQATFSIPVDVTDLFSSPSPGASPIVYTTDNLIHLLQNYEGIDDALYQPRDNKINMLDAAFVMSHL